MIDHLVLATPDVVATAAEVRTRWGVPVVAGGQHVGMGTRNELTGLGGGTYLEIVGPDAEQPAPAGPRPFGVDDLAGARLVAWCARPARPLDEVLAGLAAAGFDPGPAAGMSRARPDGVLLQWRLTFPVLAAPHHGVLPFLIDWLDSPHPTAGLPHEATLRTLHLTHPQPDALRAALALLGDDRRVEIAEGTHALAATVDTPHGPITL